MSNTDITARVTFLGEFTGKELVEFGAENTIGDKLALFADLTGHLEEGASLWTRKISPETSSESKDHNPSRRAMPPRIEHRLT